MAQQTIPLFSDNTVYPIDFQGQTFFFDYYFSKRGDCWYLTISDSNEEPIYAGMRLTHHGQLIPLSFDERSFNAVLTLTRLDGLFEDPTEDDLTNCELHILDGIDKYIFTLNPPIKLDRFR